jgi:hypothetical protein
VRSCESRTNNPHFGHADPFQLLVAVISRNRFAIAGGDFRIAFWSGNVGRRRRVLVGALPRRQVIRPYPVADP